MGNVQSSWTLQLMMMMMIVIIIEIISSELNLSRFLVFGSFINNK